MLLFIASVYLVKQRTFGNLERRENIVNQYERPVVGAAPPINLTLMKERLIRTLNREEEQRMLRSTLVMSQRENIRNDDHQRA